MSDQLTFIHHGHISLLRKAANESSLNVVLDMHLIARWSNIIQLQAGHNFWLTLVEMPYDSQIEW